MDVSIDDLNTMDGTSGPPSDRNANPDHAQDLASSSRPGEDAWRSSNSWRSWDSNWDWTASEWQSDWWNRSSQNRPRTYATQIGMALNTSADGAASDVVPGEPASSGTDPWTGNDPWNPVPLAADGGRPVSDHTGGYWRSWDWSDDGWSGRSWQTPSDQQWNQWQSNVKPDYSDPPTWPGWAHRRLWVQAVKHWNKNTDVPTYKRAEKLLRSFGWEMQSDFEHLSEEVLVSSSYLDVIIEVINSKAGVREEDDKRRAYKQAITDNQRHRDETLAQYSVRRQRDFSAASSFGVVIPDALKAMLMREGAGLSDQSQQNLMALLQGNEDNPDAVARALSRMDVRHDRLSGYVDKELFEEVSGNYVTQNYEASEDEDALDEQETLKELEPLDLNEDQITEVFAVLDQRRRTWKQNKLFKADMKKDRGSFSKDGQQGYPRGQAGGVPGKMPGRPRLNKEQLKKVSKCRLCHKRGHWAEDCVLKKKPPLSAFTYLGGDEATGGIHFCFHVSTSRSRQDSSWASQDG